MNNLELDAVAQGLFAYLQNKIEHPLDAIAIVGMLLLKIFDSATQGMTVEQFANDFKLSMIESYRNRSSKGPESLQ